MPTEELVKSMPTRRDELMLIAANAWSRISALCRASGMPIETLENELRPAVDTLVDAHVGLSKLSCLSG